VVIGVILYVIQHVILIVYQNDEEDRMGMPVKDKVYTFRTYSEKIEAANEVLASEDLDLPTVFNSVLDQIVITGLIPIKTVEEIEAEAFLHDLHDSLDSRFQKMLAGEYATEAQVRSHFES
jgi:antitoxin component of RelBE/YafQ-DinJ toxin-antitoxin module